jgi:hypothetical protein
MEFLCGDDHFAEASQSCAVFYLDAPYPKTGTQCEDLPAWARPLDGRNGGAARLSASRFY